MCIRDSRIYKAADEGAARMMAFKDGTVIETIHELPPDPPEPATDKQKIYAAALAIDFSPGISKDRISELIDAHFDKNEDVVGILQHLSDAHRTDVYKRQLLVPMNDPAAMTDAVCRILGDPTFAAAMGQKGRQRALDLFTIQRTAAQTMDLYDRLLAGN